MTGDDDDSPARPRAAARASWCGYVSAAVHPCGSAPAAATRAVAGQGVARRLEAAGAIPPEIVVIKTSGDRLGEAPLAEAGGKRLFVKEIEDALLAGTIDVAVHSTKDLPVVLPDGLVMGASCPARRHAMPSVLPARHAAVPKTLAGVSAVLGTTPRIGTSSIRRITQQAVQLSDPADAAGADARRRPEHCRDAGEGLRHRGVARRQHEGVPGLARGRNAPITSPPAGRPACPWRCAPPGRFRRRGARPRFP